MAGDNEQGMDLLSMMGAGLEDVDALRFGSLTVGLYALSSYLGLGSCSFGIYRFALGS